MEKPKKVKLIPPDLNQCQGEKKEGCWPDSAHFMIIGPRELKRCQNVPIVIVKEKVPSEKDGQCGSMSLCPACFVAFIKQTNEDKGNVKEYDFEEIKRTRKAKQK